MGSAHVCDGAILPILCLWVGSCSSRLMILYVLKIIIQCVRHLLSYRSDGRKESCFPPHPKEDKYQPTKNSP